MMTQILTKRYRDRLAGVLSCYDESLSPARSRGCVTRRA